MAKRVKIVKELRGIGLIRGVQVEGEAQKHVTKARELGLLLVAAGADVVRLLPPLNTPDEDLDKGVELLEEALS
jgi:acetylornithine/succinyldiaminopimelate/putrescine aminotransferase